MNVLKLATMIVAVSGAASAQVFTGSFPLTTNGGTPIGLDHNGGGSLLFTCIGTVDELGITDTSGNIGLTIDISMNSGTPLGVTTDSVLNIWITDATDNDVDLYDGLGNYVSSFPIGTETTFPEGIAFSPVTGNLYVTDGLASQAFEYTTAGVLVNTIPLNGASIDGIAHDPSDDTFWIYDSGTDSIRHYDAAFNELSAVPGTIANGLSGGEGLAIIGDTIYVCATGSDEVAAFAINGTPATTAQYGTGCPPPNDFYELFLAGANDLSGTSFTILPGPSGFTVAAAGAFDPNFANNLGSVDDQLFVAQALGFTATFPGLGTISTIDIDSNGRIGVGLAGSDFTESVGEFLAQTMVGVCWDDFNPSAGGAVYFDTFPTFAMITWDQVPQFGDTDSNTFQVKLHDDGRIECSYVSVLDDSLVGLSAGIGGTDPGSIDLSASLPFATAGSGLPLTLSEGTRPVIGTNFDMVTTNIPATAISGGTILGLAATNITTPIIPTGCAVQSTGDLTTLPLNLGTGASNIALPNLSSLVGVTVFAQSVIIDPAQTAIVPALYSNGLQIDIGDV
ncbi:MAG: hypothetical protein AAF196_08845 [Planctomycetota bacterium]